mmetsp:Transcript_54303/g.80564  ORF Transcript_54303/g.80564 Transcript_54303/m.80564 type:complete len:102 (+) Transcript_54303:86-391(+)|eukprot:CAMPEP_0195511326 /NCGR_PEP_ID=MMETSP0794_2-20130614/3690_1 /TAXON_ID=515487 /ORGANISM="Stephanopyxis turris, Strain CCMP 815" /LENGTH=101 /DNA_ID=CAMNT_0040638901 /DNA_START=68 /DNA_END=373 /DNA_ORIENTATION=+
MENLTERRQKDHLIRERILEKLEATGEKTRLRKLLEKRLVESGWVDSLKEYCKDAIASKGLEKIKVEDLVKEIAPRGRATVPDEIKSEILNEIRTFVANED